VIKAKKAMQKLSNQWLTKAKGDLVSAKIMYDNKAFVWAIFVLQQACKKASKAFLIRMGFLPGLRHKRTKERIFQSIRAEISGTLLE
jgi:HEPN domain-containing protein